MFKRIIKTKTFWAAMTAIVASLEQVVTGQMNVVEGVQLVLPAVLALFLRDGMAKAGSMRSEGNI